MRGARSRGKIRGDRARRRRAAGRCDAGSTGTDGGAAPASRHGEGTTRAPCSPPLPPGGPGILSDAARTAPRRGAAPSSSSPTPQLRVSFPKFGPCFVLFILFRHGRGVFARARRNPAMKRVGAVSRGPVERKGPQRQRWVHNGPRELSASAEGATHGRTQRAADAQQVDGTVRTQEDAAGVPPSGRPVSCAHHCHRHFSGPGGRTSFAEPSQAPRGMSTHRTTR